jgi:hypothetical protein
MAYEVAAINAALISGGTYRNVAERYGTSATTIVRHRPHIARAIEKVKRVAATRLDKAAEKQETAVAIREVVEARTLLERLLEVHRVTKEILTEARESKDGNMALRAIVRMENQLLLEARLLGELKDAAPAPQPVIDLSALSEEDLSHLEVVIERATIRGRSGQTPPERRQMLEVSQKG